MMDATSMGYNRLIEHAMFAASQTMKPAQRAFFFFAPRSVLKGCLMSLPVLQSLFGYKAWANVELFGVLATVTSEADKLATLRTMNHIYVADRIFRAHLLGEEHGYQATNTKDTPSLAALREAVAATDAWYVHHVASLTMERLEERLHFQFTDGDKGAMTREEMLMHVITHGAYHRGNVGQILKNLAIAPPRDLLTKFLHIAEPARRA
jgi:uncharacterized damage-inducible protein DinB